MNLQNATWHRLFSQSLYKNKKLPLGQMSFLRDLVADTQADLRPVHYENGDILYENGKIYLTFSIRMQADGIQGIFSWVPGTAQPELTGALFFDCGDGKWRNYIASSLLYDRIQNPYERRAKPDEAIRPLKCSVSCTF